MVTQIPDMLAYSNVLLRLIGTVVPTPCGVLPSNENSNTCKAVASAWIVQKFVCTYAIYIAFSKGETRGGNCKIATLTSRL